MKFHLFYHIVEDLENVGNPDVFNTTTFEEYNVYIKNAYRGISRQRCRCLEETVYVNTNHQIQTRTSLNRKKVVLHNLLWKFSTKF